MHDTKPLPTRLGDRRSRRYRSLYCPAVLAATMIRALHLCFPPHARCRVEQTSNITGHGLLSCIDEVEWSNYLSLCAARTTQTSPLARPTIYRFLPCSPCIPV